LHIFSVFVMLRQLAVSLFLASVVAEDSHSLLQGLKQATVNQMLSGDSDGSDGKKGNVQHEQIKAIPCVAWKAFVKLGLVDPTCVTDEDATLAMTKMGFGQWLTGGMMRGFTKQRKFRNVTCLDLTTLEGNVVHEHAISTGIVDPRFDKARFEDTFQTDAGGTKGKKADGKALVGMDKLTSKTLAFWKKDQEKRTQKGDDVKGEVLTDPYGPWSIIFDLFGEAMDPPAAYGKVLKYDDLKRLTESGHTPPNTCATQTVKPRGVCAEVDLPLFEVKGTPSVTFGMNMSALQKVEWP